MLILVEMQSSCKRCFKYLTVKWKIKVVTDAQSRSGKTELDMGWVHPWVVSGWVGSGHIFSFDKSGRVGSVVQKCTKCNLK